MFNWQGKASNAILLDENTGSKGRYFKARFLQPGLVKYSFGVCVLSKEAIDKFVSDFVGCPVIIDHQDVTNENAKDIRCGDICHVWYDDNDGWYWLDGIIHDEKALSLINDGYNVSCQYEITEYAENRNGNLHNGNEYDKVILNGKPEHLAIVKNPRYENALIAVNAIAVNGDNEQQFRTADDGHVYPIKEDKRGVEYLNDIARRIKVPLNFSAVLGKKGCFEARLTPEGRRRWGNFIEESFQGGLIDKRGWDKDSDGDVFKVKFKSKEDNVAQNASDKDGKWITVKGTHVFIKDGQSVEDAMKETFGSSSTGKRKQDSNKGAGEKYYRQKDDEDLISEHDSIQKQKEELLKKLRATDDVKEGDEILAQMDELNKQQDAIRQKRMDIAKDAYTKSKDLEGKYSREDADFDIEQAKKDIEEAQSLGYEKIGDIAEFLGLDEDEVREFLNPSAKNSVEEQFKECLYDLAAETIIEKLKDSHYLKM